MSPEKRQRKQHRIEQVRAERNHIKTPRVLELVLKADEAGTMEAAAESLFQIQVPEVCIQIIHKGVGPVTQSDLLMAQTGSRLVVGFNSGIAPSLKKQIASSGVEVRLYEVIYALTRDVEKICRQLIADKSDEKILGTAKIIATFAAAKGMIIGCEVTQGVIAAGKNIRLISAMGPVYTGKAGSLQIEKKTVAEGKTGEQIGIHLPDWKKAKIGDWVECFEPLPSRKLTWKPRPGIYTFS